MPVKDWRYTLAGNMATVREKIGSVLDPVEAMRPEAPHARPVASAVIVPIVVNEEVPLASELLFTLRTRRVKNHKGQVSFPGGVFENRDENLLQTAVRETREETGIEPESYTVAGMMKPYGTLTGYRIYPFVGLLDERPLLTVNTIEIEKSFYVPLGFLLDPSRIEECAIDWEGCELRMKAFKWEGMIIWGATFNILVDMIERFNRIEW
jgi:8-oxo-dGTP pyrophosphatase MutT (NUDIX family)